MRDDQIAALASTHSGLPRVTITELALLMHAAARAPVAVGEIVAGLIEWFSPMLSDKEVATAAARCLDMGWMTQIELSDGELPLQTPSLGSQVIEAMRQPLIWITAYFVGRQYPERPDQKPS